MTLRILVVDDELEIRRLLKDILSDEGHHVDLAGTGAQARALRAVDSYDLTLLDIWMPDVDGITLLQEWAQHSAVLTPVVMMSGHATIEAAVQATRLGALDFIEKPLSLSKLLQVVQQVQERGRLPRAAGRVADRPAILVGRSRVMQQLREHCERIAATQMPTLLQGEPGVGRECAAHYIHLHSGNPHAPWVVLNVAQLADATAAVVLFGEEAAGVSRPGLVERAQGGTLLLKSLDDATPLLQRLLLSVLETGAVTRVGSTQPKPVALRWLATARPGLLQRADDGGIRRDLLTRLSAVTVTLPPLRDHSEDVPELLRFFAEQLADAEHLPLRRFGLSAQNRLRHYPWPGNVAELRTLVQRLLILGGAKEIRLDELERELHASTAVDEPLVKHDLLALPLREAREQFERAYLLQQLSLCNGKVGQLAKRVGMERTHLYRKLRLLGVDFRQLADD